MSTNINITVGDNALLNAAKANQAANRQAQLEREASKKLEAEATDARTKANAAAGKDANGNPLYGVPTAKPDIDRRPAANRSEVKPAFLLSPINSYTGYGYNAITKSIKNKTFTNITASSDGSYVNYFYPEFISSGGPGNAAYLRAPTKSTGAFYFNLLAYALCDVSNTTGLRYSNPFRVLTDSGEVEATQIKKPIHKLTEYTCECYLHVDGSTTNPAQGSVSSYTVVQLSVENEFVFSFYLVYIDQGINNNNFYLQVRVAGNAVLNILFGFNDPNAVNPYLWPDKFNFGSWYHVALVRKNNIQTVFFAGKLIATFNVDMSSLTNLPDTALADAYLELSNGGVQILRPGIHGYRFTSKAIYTSDFTPPVRITGLA